MKPMQPSTDTRQQQYQPHKQQQRKSPPDKARQQSICLPKTKLMQENLDLVRKSLKLVGLEPLSDEQIALCLIQAACLDISQIVAKVYLEDVVL